MSYQDHPDIDINFTNINSAIWDKTFRKLHNKQNHPINIVKNHIYKFFDNTGYDFSKFDNLDRVVSVYDNFDSLLIPHDHPARSKSDTYYLNSDKVLRTQTSAHQVQLLKKGETSFLVTGDVYRKDEIDKYHYPVFHQLEGVRLCDNPEIESKKILSELIEYLFPNAEYRFIIFRSLIHHLKLKYFITINGSKFWVVELYKKLYLNNRPGHLVLD